MWLLSIRDLWPIYYNTLNFELLNLVDLKEDLIIKAEDLVENMEPIRQVIKSEEVKFYICNYKYQ